jgi:hypothetical protein
MIRRSTRKSGQWPIDRTIVFAPYPSGTFTLRVTGFNPLSFSSTISVACWTIGIDRKWHQSMAVLCGRLARKYRNKDHSGPVEDPGL